MSRHRISKRGSKRLFRGTAARTHKMNLVRQFRGGIRL